ncbi:hypothetical protein D3C75_617210 [compost metagenome]
MIDGSFVGSDWAVVMLPIHLSNRPSQQRVKIAVHIGVGPYAIRGEHVSMLGEHGKKEKILLPSSTVSVFPQKLGRDLELAGSPQMKKARDLTGRYQRPAHLNRRLLEPNLTRNSCAGIGDVPGSLSRPLPH